MPSANPDTLPSLAAPTVLAVSCPPELVARCAEAIAPLGLALQACGFLEAATMAAERRPLAIVVVEDVYAFDPDEFDALARDVRASLVRVEEGITVPKLELILEAAVDDAAQRRRAMIAAWSTAPQGFPGARESAIDEDGRRTVPNPQMLAYRVGQRLPSRADLAAAAWIGRIPTPAPPSSRRGA
jgi:hypothetical protein